MKKRNKLKKAGVIILSTIIAASTLQIPYITANADSKVSPVVDELVDGSFDASTESLSNYQVPEWYRDAKFGIFIHYGIYAVPAFGDEWYGHWMYMSGTKSYGGSDIFTHHKNVFGGASAFGYKDFIPEFAEDLKSFSTNNMAQKWADLFKEAGAKYVMPVGIHHDSFALYNSDVQTTYNSVTQAGVDYIGQLQTACKSNGMHFGISNHFAENDWFFDDSKAAGTDMAEKNADGTLKYGELYGDGKSKSSDHIHKWYNISMEIINKYKPDLIYYDFDLSNDNFNKYDDANRYLMLANYYNQAAINNPDGVGCFFKAGAYKTSEALSESERAASSEINPYVWQTCTSIGKKSWGYTTDEVYRTGEEFIGGLVDIVSKNGNLLLNVGPMADGIIPEKASDALLIIGNWLSKYGDAIYATRPWFVYGEGPTKNAGDNYVYKTEDIRFTKSKDNSKLYATALAKPTSNTMKIETLNSNDWDSSTIKAISLINGSERTQLDWDQDSNSLNIYLPDDADIDTAYSVELTFNDNVVMPLTVDATSAVDVAKSFDTYGVTTGSCSDDGSDTLCTTTKGYARFQVGYGNDFTPTSYNIRVSNDSEGTVEVRLDNYDGKLIGKTQIESDVNNGYRDITDDLYLNNENINDRKICIVFKGNMKTTSFNLADQSSDPGYSVPTGQLNDDSEPFFTPEPTATPVPEVTASPSTNAPAATASPAVTSGNVASPIPNTNQTVSFAKKSLTVGIGETVSLNTMISPSNTDVVYNSSNKKIVTVSSKGIIKAKRAGKVVITATSNSGISSQISVIVKKAPSKIIVLKSSYNIKKGKIKKIAYKLTKGSACYRTTFKSNNKSIAVVSSTGLVKAKKAGTATIRLSSYNNKKAYVKIIVK